VRKWVIGGIVAVAVAGTVTGGAIAFASNDGEGGASGPQADRAVQAALEATGGGTVGGVERDGESGGVWEVEVHSHCGSPPALNASSWSPRPSTPSKPRWAG